MIYCDNFKCEVKQSCRRYRKDAKKVKHLEYNDWIYHSYEKEKCKEFWSKEQ